MPGHPGWQAHTHAALDCRVKPGNDGRKNFSIYIIDLIVMLTKAGIHATCLYPLAAVMVAGRRRIAPATGACACGAAAMGSCLRRNDGKSEAGATATSE